MRSPPPGSSAPITRAGRPSRCAVLSIRSGSATSTRPSSDRSSAMRTASSGALTAGSEPDVDVSLGAHPAQHAVDFVVGLLADDHLACLGAQRLLGAVGFA